MNMINRNYLIILFAFLLTGWQHVTAQHPYRWADELELLKRVDKLPEYRTGSYVEQFSSYDRTGGNDDGFAGTYSYLRKEGDKLIIAEMEGPGVINRIWTPTPTDNMLYFYFDGQKEPGLKIKFSDLFSGKVFPFTKPVCGNEIGGFYCYLPITYKKSCKIVFDGPKLEFIQIQYRNLPGKKVETYTGKFSRQDKELLAEVNRIWADLTPAVTNYTFGRSVGIRTQEKVFTLRPGEEIPFFEMQEPGRIVGMTIDGGTSFEGLHKDVILSARWDNEKVEAIYAPLTDFFGYAYGKGAMRSMVMGKQGAVNYCYLPMPFDRSASMKMIYKKRPGVQQSPISVSVKVYYNNRKREVKEEGKFYSLWRREKTPLGEFHQFLAQKGKGHYVGTIHQAQGLRPGMTLFFEGDDSTYVDNKMRLHGTGSEDYYNGGWYALLDRWDRGNSLPLHGCLDYSLPMARTGGYRFFLSDKMSYEKEIFHGMEHGEVGNNFPVDYTSVSFFYAAQPLQGREEPSADLRTVYQPTEHIYFPQLMQINIGGGVEVSHDRGIRMNTRHSGVVRVMLDDVPEGKYKLLINYFEKPNGADFQVWQRQKQLSGWISAKGGKEVHKDRVYIGDINLTEQTNSISFHIRNNQGGEQFELGLIILERIKPNAVNMSNVRRVSRVTGDALPGEAFYNPNRTGPDYEVFGTDLGFMWQMDGNRVGMFFGDTSGKGFVVNKNGGNGENWRSNVLAFSTDTDLSDGLKIDGMVTDENGSAREVCPGAKANPKVYQTSIPTAAIRAEGMDYVHIMNIYDWGAPHGRWFTNYSTLYASRDEGQNWQRCEEVTFAPDSHFSQVAYAGKDGWIYMIGTQSGRGDAAYLARFKEKDIRSMKAYEYWNADSKRWVRGNETAATPILRGPVGEASLLWHKKLKRWILTYNYDPNYDKKPLTDTHAILYCEAEDITRWSEPKVLLTAHDYPGLYCAYMHPLKDNEDKLWFVMSMWGPYNTFLMSADLTLEDTPTN